MSIADHFEHAPDAGFVRDYDRDSARHQFNVSLVLVVVLALAVTALGFLINFDGPSHAPDVAGLSTVPSYAGKL